MCAAIRYQHFETSRRHERALNVKASRSSGKCIDSKAGDSGGRLFTMCSYVRVNLGVYVGRKFMFPSRFRISNISHGIEANHGIHR